MGQTYSPTVQTYSKEATNLHALFNINIKNPSFANDARSSHKCCWPRKLRRPMDQDQQWLLNCLVATLDTNQDVRSLAEASLQQATLRPGFQFLSYRSSISSSTGALFLLALGFFGLQKSFSYYIFYYVSSFHIYDDKAINIVYVL